MAQPDSSASATDASSSGALPRIAVLILAGEDSTKPSRLTLSEGVAHKALIEVGSRPMIDWTLDAVRKSPRTGAIIVAGLDLPHTDLGEDATQLPGNGDYAQNLLSGLEWIARNTIPHTPALVLRCDTPLITPEAITWFVDACGSREGDLHLAIVRQETLEAIYPRAKRAWLRTREGCFCSAELALVRPEVLLKHRQRLATLATKRRDANALLNALPKHLRLRARLGRAHLWELREAAQQMTGMQINLIEMPFAAPALAVDSAEDLAATRNEMAQLRMLYAR